MWAAAIGRFGGRNGRGTVLPPRWGCEEGEEEGGGTSLFSHGFRDAESGVAPPAATVRRPVGADCGGVRSQWTLLVQDFAVPCPSKPRRGGLRSSHVRESERSAELAAAVA
jgi:hypothetical protein